MIITTERELTMKKIVAGILAHVDAGKTTLSEGILYKSGVIRNAGRVDDGSTFLDTHSLERQRGITIFSKQAKFQWKNTDITLLDTPGHVDFSAEMERTLCVIDYAVLVISASEGVQGHTITLWKLLKKYNVPVFIFVNKMDMPIADKEEVIKNIKKELSEMCIDFSQISTEQPEYSDELKENIAVSDEHIMEKYIDTGDISIDDIKQVIKERKIFPCFFGSALKMEGIEEFLDGFDLLTMHNEYDAEFSAIVYKISRDSKNNRLTHMKITGGGIKVKDYVKEYDEKINQIRVYSGEKFESVNEVSSGEICEVMGLDNSKAGDMIGKKQCKNIPVLEPVMVYSVIFEENVNLTEAQKQLKQLEEEFPEICVTRNEKSGEILVKVMGQIQIEVLRNIVKERFGMNIDFGKGKIVYKETVCGMTYGVGHFEPLRHYAEVHLLIEQGERGSGIQVDVQCSEDELAKNWQRLIVTHLEEKAHLGVLTGSCLTDIKFTVVGGRAHTKHTEGGDFRQATYRAVRQGLMYAKTQILEPYYDFTIVLPAGMVGKVMNDLEQMSAHFQLKNNDTEMSELTGYAPVSLMQDYALKVGAYTRGKGSFNCTFRGYEVCHNQQEVIEQMNYDVYSDVENTPDSVFCSHGAGYIISWDEVYQYMHVEMKKEYLKDYIGNDEIYNRTYVANDEISYYEISQENNGTENGRENKIRYENKNSKNRNEKNRNEKDGYEKDKELEEIFLRTYGSNKAKTDKERKDILRKRTDNSSKPYVYKPVKHAQKYLLVDGYNIIFAWKELNELARINIDAARDKLLDIMSNYQGYKNINLMVVFDAYKVKGFGGEKNRYNNIWVVFTKEAQTADGYIERFAHDNGKKYDIMVATSDGLEQIIITGQGCRVISAREFEREVNDTNQMIRNSFLS